MERLLARYEIEMPLQADENWLANTANAVNRFASALNWQDERDVMILQISFDLPADATEEELAHVFRQIDALVAQTELRPGQLRPELNPRMT